MSDASKKQGQNDGQQNNGPQSPGSFNNDKDRKDYDTAYQQAKKDQKK